MMGFKSLFLVWRLWVGFYRIVRKQKLAGAGLEPKNPMLKQDAELDELLKTLPETMTIETKTLINLVLKLEEQEEIKAFGMLKAIDRLETETERLKALFYSSEHQWTKVDFYRLFLPFEVWGRIFTQERIQAWQAEAEHHPDKGA